MIKLICDVCADIPLNIASECNITMMPMTLTVNDVERIYSAEEFNAQDFYNGMRAGDKCSTSQINAEKYIEFFTPILEEGNDIIYICLSSGLSGSYNSSLIAIHELKNKYPNNKIHSVDSLGASLGEGLLVLCVAKQLAAGKSFEEIVEYAENIKHNVMLWFTVDDLKYLLHGGRVSKTSAIVGTLLDIKPVLQCNAEGKLVPYQKVRGRKKAINNLLERMKEFGDDIDNQEICISHCDAIEDARILEQEILKVYPNCKIIIGDIGAVIGSHSGPGTLALFFIGEKRFV